MCIRDRPCPLPARPGHLLHPETDDTVHIAGQHVERERLETDELLIGGRRRWLVRVFIEPRPLEVAVGTTAGNEAGKRDRGERDRNSETHNESSGALVGEID